MCTCIKLSMQNGTDNSISKLPRNFVRRGKPKPRFDENKFDLQKAPLNQPTVLIFEPNDRSQKTLCKFFKKNGYRTLSTQRPESVEFQFNTWPKPDLLIISGHQQLHKANKTFNTFTSNPYLAKCPVLLIGAERHKEFLSKHAVVDRLRKVILTPFKTSVLLRVTHALIRRARQS